MKHYNVGPARNDVKERLIDYRAFVNGLRVSMNARRAGLVDQAWCKIAGDAAKETATVGEAKAAFAYEEFDKWCQAISVEEKDDGCIYKEQFVEFYADISMAFFEDCKFLKLVEDTWQITEPADVSVHPKELEALIAATRHNLLKLGSERHTEEFILREIFREFDRNSDGVLSKNEL